ncbi:MAG: GAF domain-containing protein [Gaiellaceae bacterium]
MSLQAILDQLREDTAVFRTTLRLEADNFEIAFESLGEGAASLKGPLPFDLRNTGTYMWIAENRTILVQPDVLEGPNPPRELHDVYGVRSQMLSGLFDGDDLVGIISVHHAATTREWADAEVAALERATVAVEAELAAS